MTEEEKVLLTKQGEKARELRQDVKASRALAAVSGRKADIERLEKALDALLKHTGLNRQRRRSTTKTLKSKWGLRG